MKKGLAMLLVLGVVAQEGWACHAAAGVSVGGAGASIINTKCEECGCNCSDGKSFDRDSGNSKAYQKGKKENKANTDGK